MVNVTEGPIHAPSSMTEYSGMKALEWTRTRWPISTWCSTIECVPMLTSSPIELDSRIIAPCPVWNRSPMRLAG